MNNVIEFKRPEEKLDEHAMIFEIGLSYLFRHPDLCAFFKVVVDEDGVGWDNDVTS